MSITKIKMIERKPKKCKGTGKSNNYKKTFKDFWCYADNEYIECLGCRDNSVDIHHLIFRSQGGNNSIENLVPLCRTCHDKAHTNKSFNHELKTKHDNNLEKLTHS